MIAQQEVDARMERFREVCRNAGIKLTHQRMEIFREIAVSTGHPDTETIYRSVRERVPTVSLDTVYRTLWLLTDLGLLNTLGSRQERVRFDANTNPHHHFVCTKCGKTLDFYHDAFNALEVPDEVRELGQVLTSHVEVRGVCEQCKAQTATIET